MIQVFRVKKNESRKASRQVSDGIICMTLGGILSEVFFMRGTIVLGTKVNNMASRVKGLVCLWHHEHSRTYRSHDFSGGGRSRVLVS